MGKRLKTATLSLRLKPELKERAEKVAEADHRTLTSLIEKLLSDHIEQHERGKPANKKK
jgi:predicted transcriptional regulator